MVYLFLSFLVVANSVAGSQDAANSQLITFSESVPGPAVLSMSTGCPVQARKADSTLNSNLLQNSFFLESASSLVNERIPERIFHSKGSAAFGYFDVTNNASDLTKAKFLDTDGKKTRVAVRFSSASLRKGSSDLTNNVRGFAVKFYTEDGNFDVPGINQPVMVTREPLRVIAFSHATDPNPVTNINDNNMKWDFFIQNPESFFASIMYPMSPRGLPLSYRCMPGYGIHTLQLANSEQETHFTRFYFTPDLGIQNLTAGSTTDDDYLGRDLYNAIANETYPSWTVYIQPLTRDQVNNASQQGFDVFDVTKALSTDEYPLREVGKIILNENPQNYFADVEQIAYNPGNVVPGILGAPDQLYQARTLIYTMAQTRRLGNNYNKIHVNQPNNKVYNYAVDGVPPTLNNSGGAPSYFPNSFNGPEPVDDYQPELIEITERRTTNANQAAKFYVEIPEADQAVLVKNVAATFSGVKDSLKSKGLALIAEINKDFSELVAAAIAS